MTAMEMLAATFTKGWLPDDKRTGNAYADTDIALSMAHAVPGKRAGRIVSGTLLIGEQDSVVNVDAPPCNDLPNGVTWATTKERRVNMGDVLRSPPEGRFLVLELGKQRVDLRRLVVSGPGTVAFNAPRGPEWVARWDVIRQLQQSNLRTDQIRQLQRLLQRRLVEEDVAPIDAAIAKITANPSLLDLIERATDGDISAFAFAASTRRKQAATGEAGDTP